MEPPGPLQFSVNEFVDAVSVPVVALPPLTDLLPLQALFAGDALAVQLVALDVLQVSVEAVPLDTAVGFALSETVGAAGGGDGGAVTVTVADRVTLPPLPAQVNENVLVAVSAAVATFVPDTALLPDHAPDAVHEVALVELQVNFDAVPLDTVVGSAPSVSVGAGGGVVAPDTLTVTDFVVVPPPPSHVRVNVLVVVSAPVDCELDAGFGPDQAPNPSQLVASLADQDRVDDAPLLIDAGLALSVMTGAGEGSGEGEGAGAAGPALTVAGVTPASPPHAAMTSATIKSPGRIT
jgi:hypothetical protein